MISNNDGRVDTSEAIYALQVASGVYPEVSTSCLLSGKGDWSTNTEYVECDVVFSDGENYVCNSPHISSENGVFADDVANWDLLSLKGDTGEPGEPGGCPIEGDLIVPNNQRAECSWTGATRKGTYMYCPDNKYVAGFYEYATQDYVRLYCCDL